MGSQAELWVGPVPGAVSGQVMTLRNFLGTCPHGCWRLLIFLLFSFFTCIWRDDMLLLSQEGSGLLRSQGNLQPSPAPKGTGRAGEDGPGQMDPAQCAGGVVRSYRLPLALQDPNRLGSESLNGSHCSRGFLIYSLD